LGLINIPLTPKWQLHTGHTLWENIPIRRKTNFITRTAAVTLTADHKLPVLLYEYYPIKIHILNCENGDIETAKLTCSCANTDETNPTQDDTFLSYTTDSSIEITRTCTIKTKPIPKDGQIEQDLFALNGLYIHVHLMYDYVFYNWLEMVFVLQQDLVNWLQYKLVVVQH
ncbi:unnamed protein product, partial [Didymodactylos carnosus]